MKRSMFALALLLGLFFIGLPATAHAQGRGGHYSAPRGNGYAPRGNGYAPRGNGYENRGYGYRYEVPGYYGPRYYGPGYGVGVYGNPAPVFEGYQQVWDPYLQQWVSVPVYWYPNYGYSGYWRGGVFFRWGRR